MSAVQRIIGHRAFVPALALGLSVIAALVIVPETADTPAVIWDHYRTAVVAVVDFVAHTPGRLLDLVR
ncbi:hypothetical protein [Saccharothrix sp. HUAS TT1]|uniref:hypothetical protein n=1 Tax=unclassified Saccharothrix TaxID=2593673 RepID=UPI00345BC5F7